MKGIATIIFTCFLCLATSNAQDYVGISAGTSHYFGDLAKTTTPFSTGNTKAVVGVEYLKFVADRFYLGTAVNIGSLAADDLRSTIDSHRARSYDFTTLISELQLQIGLDLLDYHLNNTSTLKLRFSSGIAGIYCKTTHSNSELTSLVNEYENSSKIGFSIPFNLSLDIDMNDVTYFIQGEGRKSFSDYLDGLSILTESAANDTYGFIKLGARIPINTSK